MARVLCLHGMGGTGATMWPLVGALSLAGHDVFAPTLPGHGGTPDELVTIGWAEWVEAALDWPTGGDADVVVGQSMGAALAIAVAAEGRCQAVVAINPPAPDPDVVDGLEWMQSSGKQWLEVGPSPLGEVAYERLPIEAALSMHRGLLGLNLASVTVPVLIVTSDHDEVVDPAYSDVLASLLGGPVRRHRLSRGGHVATLDADRDRLADATTAFITTLPHLR